MLNVIPNVEIKAEKKFTGLSRQQRILRSLTFFVPATVLTIIAITAIFAPFIAPYDPTKGKLVERRLPPAFVKGGTTEHLLGTDNLGRDVLSRLIYGSRVSLSISLLAIAITAAVGTILGILAGYLGGRIDAFIMRVTDVAMAFPGMIVALLIAVGLGPGFWTVVFALSVLGWSGYARLMRGEALRIRNSDYVAQARVNGASALRIMFKHIFPNVANILIIGVTLSVGGMILAESALSYIGIGITAPTPSWGAMVSDGRNDLDRAWWISTFAGIAIGLVVLSGNFLGDWIRDKMDPRLRRL
jgi:peptide/nickel transport system permease protein